MGELFVELSHGPSGEIRTHGLMVPNHARYQLRYTRIYNYAAIGQRWYYMIFPVCCQELIQDFFRVPLNNAQ